MNLRKFPALFLGFTLTLSHLNAYEVWMGTHLSTSEMATTGLPDWALTAAQLEGFNVNRAPHDTDPASNNDYRTIVSQFTNARSVMTEFARSTATRDPEKTDELAFPSIRDRLEVIFANERNFSYQLDILMFYDERGTFQGQEFLYEWSEVEIQFLRDWLDENGQADVELMWNVRNNGVRSRALAAHPLVDSVEIEASTTALLNNTNNQITFLEWFWNAPETAGKKLGLQIPRALPGDPLNQYQGTRRVAQMLGEVLGYHDDGIRSDRLVFLPVTYNDNFPYLPETISNGEAYTNTLTSIALSLLEQRSLFEGRSRIPTLADADRTERLFAPSVGTIGDQVVSFGSATEALTFSLSDDATPASALTILKNSSNPSLVPLENIVIAGDGGTRSVTVTPAVGQSGSAEIELWVSDGALASPITFEMTVLPSGLAPGTMLSLAADASITENPSIERAGSSTVDLGARGNAPWVERCTVYVFQLPNLGQASAPFEEADFRFEFVGKNTSLRGHDLYGLGRRSSPTVRVSDFYSQTEVADPSDATRLQQSILTNNTPLGLVSTSAGGSTNLVNYLNEQYANGAGIDQYVFLRLNTRAPKSELNFATLTMSEGGVMSPQDTRPQITYQALSPAPSISQIPAQSLIVNSAPITLPFTISDPNLQPDDLVLSADSSNQELINRSAIHFGGEGGNRTITLPLRPGRLGTSEITIEVSNESFSEEMTFTVFVDGLRQVLAGWDQWGSGTAPEPSVSALGIVATATSSTSGVSWSAADNGGSGRGSSGDQTWGSFENSETPASTTLTGLGANFTALNGVSEAELTFTLSNNGIADWDLRGFHMDVIAFRPNAPRSYQVEVLSGDVTPGVIFTSSEDAIPSLGGVLSGEHDDHEEVDIDLSSLPDSVLEPGETMVLRLAFSSGTGGGGGHHLFLDNVAFSGVSAPLSALENWREENFGSASHLAVAADGFDADGDGESNLVEFATRQDPNAGTPLQTRLEVGEDGVTFSFARSLAALQDGFEVHLEWSDRLQGGSWRRDFVEEIVLGEGLGVQQVEARLPFSVLGKRFVRIRVSAP